MLVFMYGLFIFSFWCLGLNLFLTFNKILGRWYRFRLPLIQFVLLSISFFGTLVLLILSLILKEKELGIRTFFDPEGLGILLFFYGCFYLASIINFTAYRKEIKNNPLEILDLKKDEYQIIREFEPTLGDYVYLPNVGVYAKSGEKIILFPGACPVEEVDASFLCQKYEENVYGCYSYFEKEGRRKKSLKERFYGILTLFQFFCATALPVFLMYLDYTIRYVSEFASKDDERILGWLMVTLFATALLKMTDGTKGLGRILHWIAYFMVFVLFLSIFQILGWM